MKKNLITSVLMTLVTTVLFGLLFPLLITGVAQVLFPKQANGELLTRNGRLVGSTLIGQIFFIPAPPAPEPATTRAIPADQISDRPINL